MKLWIANLTNQRISHYFRVIETENNKLFRIDCGIGEQVVLFDGSTPQIDDVIDQISRYGAFAASEVLRVKDYVGHIYNIETPVKQGLIERTVRHNEGVKIAKGREFRQQTVAALDHKLKTTAKENQLPINGKLVAEISEVPQRGEKAQMGSERIEVIQEGGGSSSPRRRRAA